MSSIPNAPTDLAAHTLEALDWGVILERLAFHCHTLRGAAEAREPDFVADRAAALLRFEQVAEVWDRENHAEEVPLGAITDIRPIVEQASRGMILEGSDLIQVGACLRGLHDLHRWLVDRADKVPRLHALCGGIQVDAELRERLQESFDPTGELSEETYPALRSARRRIRDLRQTIRTTLEELLKAESMADVLQDRFVTEREGRYVLPVKANRRLGIGIVHGTSQSGETVFVEPASVVEPHNALREAEADLRRETRRILAGLSVLVGRFHDDIIASLTAASLIDLAVARAALGRAWRGVIPKVGEGEVIKLHSARHPVLQLRGIQVVPNDLALDSARPGIVFTGPNAGGKTVALKTLGLAALLVRAGIPVPAGEDTRVDFFPVVLADVGDLQTVEGDLSTFSGHVLVLREILTISGRGSLVLLDEIAVGTDPAQGAALARAILETLVDAGARVAVTTHYAELKALGANDPRFGLAATQYLDGLPTYRVMMGHAGQSHALGVARRLGLPSQVLDRARSLMDTSTRDLSDLMERLEEERARVEVRAAEQRTLEATLQAQVRQLRTQEDRLESRKQNLERELAEGFQRRIREVEQKVRDVVAALQAEPSLQRANLSLDQIRAARREVAEQQAAPLVSPSAPSAPSPQPGELYLVRRLGRMGRLLSITDDGRAEVMVGSARMRVQARDLVLPGQADDEAPPRPRRPEPRPKAKAPPPPDDHPKGDFGGLRTESTSLDLRGWRADEAMDEVESFLDRIMLSGATYGWILHGHGTGALKQAIRAWLPRCPYARRWRAASDGEGGDAWTIVELA